MTLQFYTNPMSRGRIVRWMLEELGEPYDTHLVGYGPEMKSESYRALNPMGKVPTVVHGDAVVTECAAICCYLADAFPQAGLAPPHGSALRAAYYRWLFFAAGPAETAVINAAFGFELPDTPEARGRSGWGSLEDVCDAFETLLSDGRAHVTGEAFSAADVYVGSQIGWGLEFGTLPERPGFRTYAEGLRARPAYRRATEIDEALTAEMQKG